MKFKPPPPKKHARVEIIPLIDVIFFLLATFVLISLSMTSQPGTWVNLPKSTTSAPNALTEWATISVTNRAQLFWDKEPITFPQFLNRIERFPQMQEAEGKEPHVMFNADTDAPYGQCATILDEIRKAGIEKVSILTQVQPGE
jgi:biopolymer transport protein ExbD